MNLSNKTLEKSRQLLNEATEYRSGTPLGDFFNELGFSDTPLNCPRWLLNLILMNIPQQYVFRC
jgi:hypothetical protein